MSDTEQNTTPNVVWIGPNQQQPDPANSSRQRGHYDSEKHGPLMFGPYVNLDWFLGEVERRAAEWHAITLSAHGGAFMDAAHMLAKEIKEGEE